MAIGAGRVEHCFLEPLQDHDAFLQPRRDGLQLIGLLRLNLLKGFQRRLLFGFGFVLPRRGERLLRD